MSTDEGHGVPHSHEIRKLRSDAPVIDDQSLPAGVLLGYEGDDVERSPMFALVRIVRMKGRSLYPTSRSRALFYDLHLTKLNGVI